MELNSNVDRYKVASIDNDKNEKCPKPKSMYIKSFKPLTSVSDPYHFDADPFPG